MMRPIGNRPIVDFSKTSVGRFSIGRRVPTCPTFAAKPHCATVSTVGVRLRLVGAVDRPAFYPEALPGRAGQNLAAEGRSVPAAAYLTANQETGGMVRCTRFRCDWRTR